MIEKLKPFITGPEDMQRQLDELSRTQGPTFFKLQARLPVQGRTDTIMAATPMMSVTLKTYAKSGENGLHRHANEDHAFIVLQGAAEFFGARGESRIVMRHEGVMLPSTAYYWFRATGDEPLVMIRVGTRVHPGADVMVRLDEHDRPESGYGAANKQVELILDPERVFG